MVQNPSLLASDPSLQKEDDSAKHFVTHLREQGWQDGDFSMFLRPECTDLRSFVLTNLKSRGK